jgi:hypothetical protein
MALQLLDTSVSPLGDIRKKSSIILRNLQCDFNFTETFQTLVKTGAAPSMHFETGCTQLGYLYWDYPRGPRK